MVTGKLTSIILCVYKMCVKIFEKQRINPQFPFLFVKMKYKIVLFRCFIVASEFNILQINFKNRV